MVTKLNETLFQIKVWNEIKKIPKGQITTYKEIAIKIKHPNAYRAVATACKLNPFPIKTPCHRVICSNGKIGGYLGRENSQKKIQLLKAEGIKILGNQVLTPSQKERKAT
jgi:methylated-DNA-[protein]-cysteine S-methyltransferase